jgi:hypothetical protein
MWQNGAVFKSFMLQNSNFNHFRLHAMIDYVFTDYCNKYWYVCPLKRKQLVTLSLLTFTGTAFVSPDTV